MKTLLVTGGAGFIGSNFVGYIFRKYNDYKIIVLDMLTYAGDIDNIPQEVRNSDRFEFWYGDVNNLDLVSDLVGRSEIVVHFAAETHVARSLYSQRVFFVTDVLGTQSVANAVLKHSDRVERFIHISTSEVYGTALYEPMDIVVGADCSECGESCFCNLLGAKPWPEKGCDLAVSKIQGGYLVEGVGERGEKLVRENKELFGEVRDAHVKMRDETRAKVVKDLEAKNKQYPKAAEDLSAAMRATLGDEIWEDIAARCVECGACTNICPTCYCFLLYDQKTDGSRFQRMFAWDSCQVTGYARMAGMLNPRPRLADRMKHRLYHKYDYLPLSHGAIYCTGCGRCVDTCSASIDMRDALKRIKEKALASLLLGSVTTKVMHQVDVPVTLVK